MRRHQKANKEVKKYWPSSRRSRNTFAAHVDSRKDVWELRAWAAPLTVCWARVWKAGVQGLLGAVKAEFPKALKTLKGPNQWRKVNQKWTQPTFEPQMLEPYKKLLKSLVEKEIIPYLKLFLQFSNSVQNTGNRIWDAKNNNQQTTETDHRCSRYWS